MKGRIILQASKKTELKSLTLIGKGRGKVSWTDVESYDETLFVCVCHQRANEKYYTDKQDILRDGPEIITKGRHEFPFVYKIPERSMPSSFERKNCRIVHQIKAELKECMKLTKTTRVPFTFVSKADMSIPGLMEPRYGFSHKRLIVTGSGFTTMAVHTRSMGYWQGEDLHVKVEINNQSSRDLKPKFVLYERLCFFAQDRSKCCMTEISKEKGEDIASHCKDTVMKVFTIPKDLPSSILNCSIMSLKYILKIYLDIKYAVDPKMELPIIVLPAFDRPVAFGFDKSENLNQMTWSKTPLQPLDVPPQYEADECNN
uniref:arrestin domain-containing protein 2-like isoform X2 n=1 Tax=Doryrhamphus excisus TaxID=161450 RepID=UPI0025AEB777|nr:arrestin domain-containing protein 2-like isoform X2 [Doryrhamphus excisus]